MPFGRLIVALFLIVAGTGSALAVEKRVALVIGNSTYENVSNLKNPANDASDLAASFKRIGFDDYLAANPAPAASGPAIGVITEVVSGLSRKAVTGYRMVVGSMIALLGLGFVGYGVNLVGFGLDPIATLVVQSLAILAVVPVALITYSWLATLHRGAVAGGAIPVFIFAFMVHAGIAALMGLFMTSPAVGSYLGTTAFTAARLDYLIWGAVPAALLAGLHWWWPKMLGRTLNDEVARIGADPARLSAVSWHTLWQHSLVAGLRFPDARPVVDVPEPTTFGLLAGLVLVAGLALPSGLVQDRVHDLVRVVDRARDWQPDQAFGNTVSDKAHPPVGREQDANLQSKKFREL